MKCFVGTAIAVVAVAVLVGAMATWAALTSNI